ncbi:hypothetical protein FIU97_09970 [Roseivivax sp. THAF40]|uniref:hypothetical protein n=1 Tax=unclassified Roseivivax TaxID=2639302 RepID=UPI0012692EF8|nr:MULTISPECIES: hypothetical protein [unclassified Roseivivax]QFS83153.1 hypothetical protein FIV09_09985 [Roseivivax sp. THAF197b]QFT46897.1 hypothetical protein FIU97_09970 [Roseivivax sp. THAF40]
MDILPVTAPRLSPVAPNMPAPVPPPQSDGKGGTTLAAPLMPPPQVETALLPRAAQGYAAAMAATRPE